VEVTVIEMLFGCDSVALAEHAVADPVAVHEPTVLAPAIPSPAATPARISKPTAAARPTKPALSLMI
jgi:hypothetical protein